MPPESSVKSVQPDDGYPCCHNHKIRCAVRVILLSLSRHIYLGTNFPGFFEFLVLLPELLRMRIAVQLKLPSGMAADKGKYGLYSSLQFCVPPQMSDCLWLKNISNGLRYLQSEHKPFSVSFSPRLQRCYTRVYQFPTNDLIPFSGPKLCRLELA